MLTLLGTSQEEEKIEAVVHDVEGSDEHHDDDHFQPSSKVRKNHPINDAIGDIHVGEKNRKN